MRGLHFPVGGQRWLHVRYADEVIYALLAKVIHQRKREHSLFSQRRRCLLPSLPLSKASLFTMLSRLDVGLRGGVGGDGDLFPSNLTAFGSPSLMGVLLMRWSRGIASGELMPRAAGDTLRLCRAAIVQASMSMPVLGALCGAGVPGA